MKSGYRKTKTETEVGKWEYESDFGRFIDHSGNEEFLDKRLNRLLSYLVENANSIVKREQIIEHVWNDVQVNEENLTKGIFDLRKFLKDKGINEIEIETIRNVGYRLITSHELSKKKSPKRELNWVAKSMIFTFFALTIVIILIRAINY